MVSNDLPIGRSPVSSGHRAGYTPLSSGVTISDRGDRSRRGSRRSSSCGAPGVAEHHREEIVEVRVILSATVTLERDEGDGELLVVLFVFLLVVVVVDHHGGFLGLLPLVDFGTVHGGFRAGVNGFVDCSRFGGERGCWLGFWLLLHRT